MKVRASVRYRVAWQVRLAWQLDPALQQSYCLYLGHVHLWEETALCTLPYEPGRQLERAWLLQKLRVRTVVVHLQEVLGP